MELSEFLREEWVPALGCTEPAAIALAAATAADAAGGYVKSIDLVVDPRIYKNCYAVGIPNSGHKTGILWAAALGSQITDPSLGLTCFKALSDGMISAAGRLIEGGRVKVDVDTSKNDIFIDCRVESDAGRGRAVVEQDHTNLVCIEKDGKIILDKKSSGRNKKSIIRSHAASLSIEEMIVLAKSASDADEKIIEEGIAMNMRISKHGLGLFPDKFIATTSGEALARMSTLVCAGVYARMWGEDFPVMSLAGSGNKGITAAVPISLYGQFLGCSRRQIVEALALACLVTSATTHHLGPLSAVCGCANAAGIGLSAGLVLLEGGGPHEISLAMTNMVGNVTGMICDGAKIGCALKTMTAVDSAFRAAALATSGVGIPAEDGIVGKTGPESLKNLGRIAARGMTSTDSEILAIMKEKLK